MILTRHFIILLLFTQSLLCMERPVLYKEKLKHDLTLIHQAIIAYQIQSTTCLFSHDSICALALTNKHLNITVEKSAPQRKARLIAQKEYCKIHQKNSAAHNQETWHKYNSAYTYWTDTNEIVNERKEKQITLNLVYLDGSYSICHRQLQCLATDDLESKTLIFEEYRSFFNSQGDACFHAQGQFDMQKGAEYNTLFSPSFKRYIFEYTINTKGLKKQLPCYVKNIPTNQNKNILINLIDLKDNPKLLQTIITSKPAIETPIKTDNQLEIYAKYCKVYKDNIKIYNYTDVIESSKDSITTNNTPPKPNLKESTIAIANKISETTEQKNIRISELLKNPNTPKRLNLEINKLLENKKLIIDAYSINSKTHPFEIKITLYNNPIEHIITCKIPNNYPCNAPIIFLETTDGQLETKDLITIKKNLNEKLSSNWRPSLQIYQIIDLAEAEIKSYKNKKIALQEIAKGHERTIIHLKEKYLSKNITLGNKYPEFQKKLYGLWIKEMPDGYVVFHVEGDYINIAFEPKYIGEEPLSYHGNYAAGHHNTKNNLFDILISDLADSEKLNGFKLAVNSNFISITFNSLNDDSILNTIMSHLEIGYIIGEKITLTKI